MIAAIDDDQAPRRVDARSSCSLLVQHCLVEAVADDLLQEIADQPCRAAACPQRLQHASLSGSVRLVRSGSLVRLGSVPPLRSDMPRRLHSTTEVLGVTPYIAAISALSAVFCRVARNAIRTGRLLRSRGRSHQTVREITL